MQIISLMFRVLFQQQVPTPTVHIDVSVLYYAVGIIIGIGTILWRIYSLFDKAKQHSNKNLEVAKQYTDQSLMEAVADRKVWVSEHSALHTTMVSDQKVISNEIQNELDALAEKHDSDMHAFRKTIEAVLLEKRDLEAMMRQVKDDISAMNQKIEKIGDGQVAMSTALAKITERMDIIKGGPTSFMKGDII